MRLSRYYWVAAAKILPYTKLLNLLKARDAKRSRVSRRYVAEKDFHSHLDLFLCVLRAGRQDDKDVKEVTPNIWCLAFEDAVHLGEVGQINLLFGRNISDVTGEPHRVFPWLATDNNGLPILPVGARRYVVQSDFQRLLGDACRTGEVSKVRALLASEVAPSIECENPMHLDVVKPLCSPPRYTDVMLGGNLLEVAAQYGHERLVWFLLTEAPLSNETLAAWVDDAFPIVVKMRNRELLNLMLGSARVRHVKEVVEEVLSSAHEDDYVLYALHRLIVYANERGLNLDKNDWNWTKALTTVVEAGHVGKLKLMFSINVVATSPDLNLLLLAIKKCRSPMVKYLVDQAPIMTEVLSSWVDKALFAAVVKCDSESFDAILNCGMVRHVDAIFEWALKSDLGWVGYVIKRLVAYATHHGLPLIHKENLARALVCGRLVSMKALMTAPYDEEKDFDLLLLTAAAANNSELLWMLMSKHMPASKQFFDSNQDAEKSILTCLMKLVPTDERFELLVNLLVELPLNRLIPVVVTASTQWKTEHAERLLAATYNARGDAVLKALHSASTQADNLKLWWMVVKEHTAAIKDMFTSDNDDDFLFDAQCGVLALLLKSAATNLATNEQLLCGLVVLGTPTTSVRDEGDWWKNAVTTLLRHPLMMRDDIVKTLADRDCSVACCQLILSTRPDAVDPLLLVDVLTRRAGEEETVAAVIDSGILTPTNGGTTAAVKLIKCNHIEDFSSVVMLVERGCVEPTFATLLLMGEGKASWAYEVLSRASAGGFTFDDMVSGSEEAEIDYGRGMMKSCEFFQEKVSTERIESIVANCKKIFGVIELLWPDSTQESSHIADEAIALLLSFDSDYEA
ncbi:hypothetical protein HK101_008949 [Irineochytrium annulatum]|nr:hypothetical protein HK101_008949 [Irineochytrium annulatum]